LEQNRRFKENLMIRRNIRSTLHSLLTGFLIAVMVTGSVGCATIMSDGGGDRPLRITTTPEGATVYVKRGMSDWQQQPGVTPTTIMLDPVDGDYQLKLELEGYEPILGYVDTDVDPWLFGSMALVILFVIPGVVATAIDFATGAWKKLDEEQMHFNFKKAE
jgi:hypothetical protein